MDKNNLKKHKQSSSGALSPKASLQIGLAALMLLLSLGFVVLVASGVISRPEAEHVPPPDGTTENSSPSQGGYTEAPVLTAEELINAFEKFSEDDRISTEVYGEGFSLKRLDSSRLGNTEDAGIYVKMGFVFKNADGVESIYDSSLTDITQGVAGYALAGVRDGEGYPLFVKDGKYYRIKDGFISEAEYRTADFVQNFQYIVTYLKY